MYFSSREHFVFFFQIISLEITLLETELLVKGEEYFRPFVTFCLIVF